MEIAANFMRDIKCPIKKEIVVTCLFWSYLPFLKGQELLY